YLKATSFEGSTRFRWHFKRLDSNREFLAEVQLNAMSHHGNPLFCCVLTDIAMPETGPEGVQSENVQPLELQLLTQLIDQFQRKSSSTGHYSALLYVGFDQIADIKEAHGKQVSDRLLVDMSRRLKVALRGSDEVVQF